MESHEIHITIIGSGNVATHLGLALMEAGFIIEEVFSRNAKKAAELAEVIYAQPITELHKLGQDSDVYILAISDDAIGLMADNLSFLDNKLVVHTSGATPSTALQAHKRRGVFYPLQTFSEDVEVDFEQLPICIDANKKEDRKLLSLIASYLTPLVYKVNDEQRAQLHVAAVFVNNFSNYLYQIGCEITEATDLPFDILLPLIQQTVKKIDSDYQPIDFQTGPAVRGDKATIKRHLKLIKQEFPKYSKLYKTMTELIEVAE